MHLKNCIPIVIAALLWSSQARLPCEEAPAAEEGKLLGVLGSDAPVFEKAKACQRLAVIGTKESVPVLAGLLSSEELSHYARFGLEPIPDPSVDEALRGAMGKVRGKLLVGVLNSIGQRRDAGATDGLAELLRSDDRDVAAAAAAALGKVGTTKAASVLEEAMAVAPAERLPAIADGMFFCAEALLRERNREVATGLYDAVRQADVPEHIRLAATRGAILSRRRQGVAILVEKINSEDYAEFLLALRTAREMRGPGATRALVDQIGKLSPEKQALVIKALGDRGDATARPVTLRLARGGAPEVRVAALDALASLGNASDVPFLADAATSPEAPVAEAALTTLQKLPGKDVDEAVVASLEKGEAGLRPILIETVGRRRIAGAVSALQKASEEDDPGVRKAAIGALGLTVGLEDLPILIGRLTSPKAADETGIAVDALKAACRRMPDRDACADKLGASMSGAPAGTKLLLLDVFSSLGGTKALEAVAAHARQGDEGIREGALRVLGDWGSEDAAPVLLGLVKGSQDEGERMRALRAFSNVVRRIGFAKEARLALCQESMGVARDDAERRVVLHTYAGIPAPETLELLKPYLAEGSIKEDACAAVMEICERLIRARPNDVVEPLKRVIQTTADKDRAARAEALLKQVGAKP